MIVPLEREHAIQVCRHLEETERREWEALQGPLDPERWADAHLGLPGPSFACLAKDGEPVVMGGFNLEVPGMGVGWLGVTDRFPEVAIEVTRASRKAIDFALTESLVDVVMVASAAFHKTAHRWFRTLGLERHADLPGFGLNGEDFIIFQRSNNQENDLCAEVEAEAATTMRPNANVNGSSRSTGPRPK